MGRGQRIWTFVGVSMLACNLLAAASWAARSNNIRIALVNDSKQERLEMLSEIAECSSAIEQRPNNSDAFKKRGDLYLKMFLYFRGEDNLNRALADYKAAVGLKPDDDHALESRALIYGMNHDFRLAIDDYTQVLRIRGFDANTLRARAQVQHSAGKLAEAIADYSALLAVKPGDEEAIAARAMVFRDEGNVEKANADLAYQKAKSLKRRPACIEAVGCSANRTGVR